MRNKMVILAIAFAIMMAFAGANSADAACATYGKISYMYQTTSYAYYYVNPMTTAGYTPTAYYFYTYDPELISTLSSAMVAGRTVYVYGNASSCGSGTYRYGGSITGARVYRNY